MYNVVVIQFTSQHTQNIKFAPPYPLSLSYFYSHICLRHFTTAYMLPQHTPLPPNRVVPKCKMTCFIGLSTLFIYFCLIKNSSCSPQRLFIMDHVHHIINVFSFCIVSFCLFCELPSSCCLFIKKQRSLTSFQTAKCVMS